MLALKDIRYSVNKTLERRVFELSKHFGAFPLRYSCEDKMILCKQFIESIEMRTESWGKI